MLSFSASITGTPNTANFSRTSKFGTSSQKKNSVLLLEISKAAANVISASKSQIELIFNKKWGTLVTAYSLERD